jgi:hypothetical protein
VARANETALNEICGYAVNARMYFIVFFDFFFINSKSSSNLWSDADIDPFHMAWLNTARKRWENKFLGVYLYDEPGGKQIDKGYYTGNTTTRT